MQEQDSQEGSDLHQQLEVIKKNSISAIKETAVLRDKSVLSRKSEQSYRMKKQASMNIHIKKPFLTDAEKRAQDWVLRAKSPKVPLPSSWQVFNKSTAKKLVM